MVKWWLSMVGCFFGASHVLIESITASLNLVANVVISRFICPLNATTLVA